MLVDVVCDLIGYDVLIDLLDDVLVVELLFLICDGGFIVFGYDDDLDEICRLCDEGWGVIVGM